MYFLVYSQLQLYMRGVRVEPLCRPARCYKEHIGRRHNGKCHAICPPGYKLFCLAHANGLSKVMPVQYRNYLPI